MNKTAIKNFSIWARRKLIDDISNKARLVGISEKGIKDPLSSSTEKIQFFDVGTKEPYAISGLDIRQREALVIEIKKRAADSDHKTAYNNLIEEVAYTWFNRLIAIRFMEVNSYLPSRIRVLSAEADNKSEPDIVTNPFSADLDYSDEDKQVILHLKHANKLDELFRMLFIKQCNALYNNLPELFEKINDYTELLLQISFTDKEGVINHLVNDIDVDDFNVDKEGQIEIIGWLYQFYNTEPKDETFKLLKNNVKITKERIPSATQLFTPDWIVRYMVENSLGRLWVEGHPNEEIKKNWKYYLEEAEQEEEVQKQLKEIRKEYSKLRPRDIKIIDPAMGSGHILVYAFDVLMQIYTSQGHSERDAAKLIVENNLFGLDIDRRAYQLAYFAVMMKARQYNRRILEMSVRPKLYVFEESNGIKRNHLKFFGDGLGDLERNTAMLQLEGLLDIFIDAKEYGSILNVENYNWDLLYRYISCIDESRQLSMDMIGNEDTINNLNKLIYLGQALSTKYDVIITNPPYMGNTGMNAKLSEFVKTNYPKSKSDLFAVFNEKWNRMIKNGSFNCMVTMHSWMFLSSFQNFREEILQSKNIINLMHMENMVMGIAFGTSVINLRKTSIKNYIGSYHRVLADDIDQNGLINRSSYLDKSVMGLNQGYFSLLPGSVIGYWLSHKSFQNFKNMETLGEYIDARIGLITGDNDRFLRLWHEVSISRIGFNSKSLQEAKKSAKKWFPYQKGGEYRRWYGNLNYVVDWENDGYLMKYNNSDNGRVRSHNYNGEYSFMKCITWTSVTNGKFACRYASHGFLFDAAGPICRVRDDEQFSLLLSMLSSNITRYYLEVINPTINFHPGYIMSIPFSYEPVKEHSDILSMLSEEAVEISKSDWDSIETSWDFKNHPLLHSKTIESAFVSYRQKIENRFTKLKSNEEKQNSIFIKTYGLEDELLANIEENEVTVTRVYDTKQDIPEGMKGNIYVMTKHDVIESFLSYAVGCMFGRYSLDFDGLAYAGGNWDNSKYKSFMPDKDNVIPITDEEYFEDDIVGLIVSFIKSVYGQDTLEKNLTFIAEALGSKGDSSREVIRNYFLNEFYKDHVKIYKSRPIYWLFDSGKQNGFKALVYLHRYSEDTIGKIRIDYLHRMQKIYENEINRMQKTIEESSDSREIAKATKRKEKLIKQLQETREYDEKIIHLALERISLDLDDGVKVNYEKVQTDREGRKHQVLAKI